MVLGREKPDVWDAWAVLTACHVTLWGWVRNKCVPLSCQPRLNFFSSFAIAANGFQIAMPQNTLCSEYSPSSESRYRCLGAAWSLLRVQSLPLDIVIDLELHINTEVSPCDWAGWQHQPFLFLASLGCLLLLFRREWKLPGALCVCAEAVIAVFMGTFNMGLYAQQCT